MATGGRGAVARVGPSAGWPSPWLAIGVALGQVGLWLLGREEGGVLSLIDYLAEVFGFLVPLAVRHRRVDRVVADPMTDRPRRAGLPPATSRPTTPTIVELVDEWWGGRRMRALLPRLWFQHFTGHVVDRSRRPRAGWSGSSSRSSDPTIRRSAMST